MNNSTVTIPLSEYKIMESCVKEVVSLRESKVCLVKNINYDTQRYFESVRYEVKDKDIIESELVCLVNEATDKLEQLTDENEELKSKIIRLNREINTKPFWKFW